MILLLLTSALALSFVPLTSNDPLVATTTVTIGTIAFAAADLEVTIPIKAEATVAASTNTFRLAILTAATDGTELYQVDVKAKLDGTQQEVKVKLADAKFAGQKTLYVDVVESDGTDEVTMRGAAVERPTIVFADAPVSVALTKNGDDSTKVDIAITFDTGFAVDFSSSPFVIAQHDAVVTPVDLVYTVTIPHADLLTAPLLAGYFKGTDAATSTLPIALFTATPVLTLAHKDAEKAEATFTTPPAAPGKVYLKSGVAAPELLTVAEDKCNIDYEKLASASIYYTDGDGIMTSNKLDISLPPAPAAPVVTFVKGASAAVAPKAKLTFATLTNRKLAMDNDPATAPVDVSAENPEVELEKFVGTAGCYIVLDGAVPKSLPLALTAAELTLATAEEVEGNIPVTVTIDEIGFIAAKPAGIVANPKGAADYTGAKYYGFAWGQTEGTENKGATIIPLANWKASKDKEIEAFVSPDYTAEIPATPKKITTAQKVIDQLVTTTVAIGAVEFTPADLKLKIKITAGKDISTTATGTYRLVGYSLAAEGVEVFEKEVAKTSLVGTEKEIEVVLAMDAKLKDLKTIHIDVLEKQTDKAEQSMITAARKEVTFAAKDGATAIAVAASGTDSLKFTITLDSAIADVTKVAFVFKGANKAVTAGTGTNAFDVVIAIADLLEAESTIGYFLGENQATTTLPISLFALTPDVTLEHKDDKKAEATIDNVPPQSKVYLKSGETTEELTLASKKCDITYAKLADAVIYYTDADGVLNSNKLDITLPAFTAPTTIEWIAEEEEPAESNDAVITHTVKFTFAAGVANRKLYVTATPARDAIDLSTVATETTPAKLVGTAGYYIVVEGTVPKTLPLDFEEAAFTQTPGPVAEKKVPVAVEITPGLLKAEPAGLLVYATEETDKTKMKFYPFTWDTAEDAVNKASASVEVDDFKTITDKDIESYVAPDYSEAIPETRVLLSEKAVVIAKKEPVEPEPKDEGAFGQMVSLMAVVVSLFVLAL